ncbi:MAG TPA: cysteine desulfurase [Lactobacillus sp.]|nr:cysteine desulfurase [Lactobacillus sp.]
MAFEQTVQVPGDDRVFTLSQQLKKYTLRDLGFKETNAGGFSLERPLDPAAGLAGSIKLRVQVNKNLDGFKMSTVNPSGTGNVNIFTNGNHEVLVEQYGYQIDNLIERQVIAVQTK